MHIAFQGAGQCGGRGRVSVDGAETTVPEIGGGVFVCDEEDGEGGVGVCGENGGGGGGVVF